MKKLLSILMLLGFLSGVTGLFAGCERHEKKEVNIKTGEGSGVKIQSDSNKDTGEQKVKIFFSQTQRARTSNSEPAGVVTKPIIL